MNASPVAAGGVAAEEQHPQTAQFGFWLEDPAPGEEVEDSAREPHDRDGKIVTYRWDLDRIGT